MQEVLKDRSATPQSIDEIHALAEAELKAPSAKFKALPYLELLDRMKEGPRTLPELEARIMLQFAGRIRPARTRILMNSLRSERIAKGNRAAFEDFEAMLFACLGTDSLLGHGFLPKSFKTADHDAIWSDIREAVRALEDISADVFLNSGTLLGAVRDRRLIDHDDDVDLALVFEARTEREAGRIWRGICDDLEARGLLDQGKTRKMAQVQLKTKGGTTVDLFPAWTLRGRIFVYPHTYGELNVGDVLPLKVCDLTGLRIPADPEKMLAVNYGKDWRTPDPYFTFPWKERKSRFRLFLRACGLGLRE